MPYQLIIFNLVKNEAGTKLKEEIHVNKLATVCVSWASWAIICGRQKSRSDRGHRPCLRKFSSSELNTLVPSTINTHRTIKYAVETRLLRIRLFNLKNKGCKQNYSEI